MSQKSPVKPESQESLASQNIVSGSQIAKHESDPSFMSIVLKQQVRFHALTLDHLVSAVLTEWCFYTFQNQTPYSNIEGDKIFSQCIAV